MDVEDYWPEFWDEGIQQELAVELEGLADYNNLSQIDEQSDDDFEHGSTIDAIDNFIVAEGGGGEASSESSGSSSQSDNSLNSDSELRWNETRSSNTSSSSDASTGSSNSSSSSAQRHDRSLVNPLRSSTPPLHRSAQMAEASGDGQSRQGMFVGDSDSEDDSLFELRAISQRMPRHATSRPQRSPPPQVQQADHLVRVEVGRYRETSLIPNLVRRSVSASNRQPTVIDLTDEPDEPVQAAPRTHAQLAGVRRANGWPSASPQPPPMPHREHIVSWGSQTAASQSSNPRRNSQMRRTPSLTRSDGSILGPYQFPIPVIDLTDDSEPQSQPQSDRPAVNALRHRRDRDQRRRHRMDPARQPNGAPPANNIPYYDSGGMNAGGTPDLVRDAMADRGLMGIIRDMLPGLPPPGGMHRLYNHLNQLNPIIPRLVDADVQLIGHNVLPPPVNNPLAEHPVHLNYHAMNREPPKPPFVPPEPAREGFTRDTGTDTVLICPSCEEELSFDPNEAADDQPPTKKARSTKKDREEHHFWAVKACGHVSSLSSHPSSDLMAC
jgi:hypothetical protein